MLILDHELETFEVIKMKLDENLLKTSGTCKTNLDLAPFLQENNLASQ